jgi:Zn-dependent peptidase ImmA (M78 family)/transcriptional regulator with XRE-family HTH domain
VSVGQRIRQYRSARGYTLDELASRMEGLVTKQALSKYEHDRAMPRPTVLIAIAQALEVKSARLIGEPEYGFELVAYRSLASLPKKEQESIESRVRLELESRLSLMDRLGLEHRNPFEGAVMPVSDARDAESAAAAIREGWDLGGGPIASVVDALETQGVHLIDVDIERKFDGLAVFATDETGDRVACGIACRREVSRARQRLNHAHEAGHLAMDVADCVDAEQVAHRFGAAFLFPEEAVRAEFGARRSRITADELFVAKRKWGLSIQAVLFRLRDLGILDEGGYRWWCMRINQSGWRVAEPGEEPPEHSQWNEVYAHRAAAEGLIGRETLAEYVPGTSTRTVPEDIDRRALMRLPVEERRAILKAHADAFAEEYNRQIDHEWLDADLGEWDSEKA